MLKNGIFGIGWVAVAFAVFVSGAAAAQDQPTAAELKAAHAIVDEPIAEELQRIMPELRTSLEFKEIDQIERDAMRKAFDDGMLVLVQDAQDELASAAARRWTLAQLSRPELLPEADVDELIGQLEQTMEKLGGRFAASVIKQGCQVQSKPSDFCAGMLLYVVDYEAGRLVNE